uniref:tRNA(Ile)-lysidine synthase, chloroplastic n=1 Tax=Dicloster acuatus TaxID=91190 RepID=A0A097KQK0_9CHLO|nr:hypothetical chloroplast RF62 [Dicloster acuatus]AIT95463.1 hypothetical chloroplast RF62 [Dicloster acuatus]
MKKILSEIKNTILYKNIFIVNDIYIYALSGGQDSILLFILLLHLKKQWNLKINILHFNHLWQQKNFFSSQHVWKLAFIFNNPIYIIPSEIFLYNEKKARQWRQQSLERINCLENCKKSFLGHTASDRLETAFWHLIRGTSPRGLVSLKAQTRLIPQGRFFNYPCFYIFDKKILFVYKVTEINILNYKKTFQYKKSNNKKIKASDLDSPCFRTIINSNFLFKKNKYKFLVLNFFSSNQQEKIIINNKTKIENSQSTLSSRFLKTKRDNSFLMKQRDNFCFLVKHGDKQKIHTFYFLVFNYKIYIYPYLFFEKRNTIFLAFLGPFLLSKNTSKTLKKNHKEKNSFLFFNFFLVEKQIFRLLFYFHRNDITILSKKYMLPILSDRSNEKFRWSRNRIRHQLFPLLRFFFNPNIDYLFNNFLEITLQEQEYIESLVEKISSYCLKKQKVTNIEKQIALLPKAVQKRLLQKIFQSYTKLQPNLSQIEILTIFINKNG